MPKECGPDDEQSSDSAGSGKEVESCCEFHPPQTCGQARCPSCGELGKRVRRITLGALLKPERRREIPARDEFCFCRTPACDVVYFLPDQVLFHKDDLSVRVGLKEPGNPSGPVCYCFGWTSQEIRAEMKVTGKSTAIDQIKALVKAGNCYCEVTNPQGSCCLGNVSKAIKEIGEKIANEKRLTK